MEPPNQAAGEGGKRREGHFTAPLIIKNLMVITVAIFLVEAALGPSSDLSSSLNISRGMGTTSTAIGYVFTILAYFFLPTLVINRVGLKYSMVIFVALESIPTIANFYLSWYTLIPGAIVSSVAGVITRPAQKTSVALLAEKYADLRGRDKYAYINIFFAVYYSVSYSGYLVGAVFALEALNNYSSPQFNATNAGSSFSMPKEEEYSSCGARFFDADHQASSQFERPSQREIYLYFGISAASGTLASLFIVCLFDYLENPGGQGTNRQMLIETFRIFKKRDNLLLIPTNFQRGVMDAFTSTEFTKANRILKNLMVVTTCAALENVAKGPSGAISSSLNISRGMGTTSHALASFFSVFAFLFLPTLVINKMGLKYAMSLFILLESVPGIMANVYLSWYPLIPGAVISSVASSISRTAKKTSVAILADKYATVSGKNAYQCTNVIFAIYYSVGFFGAVLGGVFTLKAFRDKAVLESNASLTSYDTCGARFYDPDHENSPRFERPDQYQIYTFFGLLSAIGFLSSLGVLVGLDALKDPGGLGISKFKMLAETFHTFKKRDNLLLLPTCFQVGVLDAFTANEFTKAYITCTSGVHSVGIIMVTYYVSQCVFSLFGAYFAKFVGRISVITFVAVLQGVLLVVLAFYRPLPGQEVILHSLVALLGLASAIYQALTSIMYSTLFAENRKAAFANFLLPTTVGGMVASAYSYYLTVWIKIVICGVFLVFSYICYLAVEVPIVISSRKAKDKALALRELHSQ